jgi:Tfp pilus assembly protein PilF
MRTYPALASLQAAMLIIISTSVLAAEYESIGTFDFPTSGSPQAQVHFELGVGYLHSFGFIQAQREFKLAQEIEPDFAMAYWGETFTYNHPFIGEWDAQSPMDTLNRLGATSEERLSKAPTEREKGFLRAAEAYAFTPGTVGNRRTAWMNAMQEVYADFGDDDEVAAFAAVSMLAGATVAGEASERLNMRAGAIALELFKKNEDHPGAAHYVIHAFDDPIHAPIALEAAFKYADTAPAVAHARHMPTHIFIQHGMWPEVAKWNVAAFDAGAALWMPGDRPNDQNHAADWGQYGDLQMGDAERSMWWIARSEKVLRENPNDARSAATLNTMRARHTIETQQWQTRELNEELDANELLALGMSAAALDQFALTSSVAERLLLLADASPRDQNLKIMYHEIAGLAELGKARAGATVDVSLQKSAVEHFTNALEITAIQRLPNGAANPLKPAHELVGEAMLASGQTEWAAELFEESLLRMPRRPLSLLGAARSQAELGNSVMAAKHYAELALVLAGSDHVALAEAQAFIANAN